MSATDNPTNEGTVVRLVEEGSRFDSATNTTTPYQVLEVRITRGPLTGQTVKTEIQQAESTQMLYQMGDKVMVTQTASAETKPIFVISDFVRRDSLLNLLLLFVLLVLAVSRWKGFLSLLAMGLSFAVIFSFTLPLIMAGWSPIVVSIITAVTIIPISFYLSHGFNRKTHLAIIGTVLSLILTSFLAWFFVAQAKLTGFSSEEAGFLSVEKQGLINIKNLILAGIIVGSLGILDDVTVSQTSVVEQLKRSNPKLSISELFKRAMIVGQDHIASMVNTLVLVYAGASLPLLLLFIDSPHPFLEVINYEIVAEEIIKTLVGSIGLIFAAPVTTGIAAWTFGLIPPTKEPTENQQLTHQH